MKAWIKRHGRLQLDSVPVPDAGPDELLVRVEVVSLNRGEVRTAARAADGAVPGWDIAGTVVKAVDGKGPAAGARVAAIVNGGAWAEFVRVPLHHAAVVPDAVALDAASTLPIAGLTVVRALDVCGSLLGRTMLVTGGSGGVGQIAIQLGALAGATVTAVSSRAAQHDALRGLGAHHVVTAIEDANGAYDSVLESVGGASMAAAIARMAGGGVVVTIGNSSEEDTTFNVRTLYAKGAARIYGLLVFEEIEHRRIGSADLARLLTLVAQERLRIPIEVRRPWTELPDVLDALAQRRYAGKAVLTLV